MRRFDWLKFSQVIEGLESSIPLFPDPQVVNVTCGIADVYVSTNNPNPNPALYSEKYTATDGYPAFIHSEASNNGRPVYMTVIGNRIEGQENCTYRIHVFVKEERK